MDRCLVTFFGDASSDSEDNEILLKQATAGTEAESAAFSQGGHTRHSSNSESASKNQNSIRRSERRRCRTERNSDNHDMKVRHSDVDDSCTENWDRQVMHCSKSCGELLPSSLPPENDEGNVEYKLKLVRPTSSRLEHLVTQLKWRLAEGQGQAVYELGVEDNGVVLGLTKVELNESLRTLNAMCRRLNASYSILRERQVDNGTRKAQEILIRRLPNDKIDLVESRLAVLGNLDAGKSTLLGVLTQGDLDNGRGRARLNLFRHPHEIQTGYTSSVSSEILGFDAKGNLINYSGNRCVEDILEESSKLYRLIDLAGHIRYQKTTLRGLMAHDPHLVALVVSSVTGLTDMAQEHAALAIGLQVPFIIVITKIDLCNHEPVLASVEAWLKATGNKRIPLVVRTKDDAITAADNLLQSAGSLTPIFLMSCITGVGLPLLTEFLNVVPANSQSRSWQQQQQQLLHQHQQFAQEFCVDSVASLSDGKSSQTYWRYVLSGPVLKGRLKEGDLLQLGPGVDGVFVPVRIASLNRNRLSCGAVQAGHWASVTVELKLDGRCWGAHTLPRVAESFARRGAFLVSLNSQPPAVLSFSAQVMPHSCRRQQHLTGRCDSGSLFRPGRRINVLSGSVCQMAIVGSKTSLLKSNVPADNASSSSSSSGTSSTARKQSSASSKNKRQQQQCTGSNNAEPAPQQLIGLRFAKQAELLRPGDRLVLRVGHRVVGVGRVQRINNLLQN